MRRARCILLLFLLLLTGTGLARTKQSGVNRLRGHFLPLPYVAPKGPRSTGWHTHPGALFYLHHLRSCAMSAWGASGAAGAGQLGCAADGCCLHGQRRWVHCNLLRASGTGILLLAAGSLLMPQWSTTPIAVLALEAKACNFHRPYRECQLLSMLVTGPLIRQWEPWVGKFLAILWAGCHPLFPQNTVMEVDSPNPVGYPALSGTQEEEFAKPFLGMTCQWRNFCAWIREGGVTLALFWAAAGTQGVTDHSFFSCWKFAGTCRPGWLIGELTGLLYGSWLQVNRLSRSVGFSALTITNRLQVQIHPKCYHLFLYVSVGPMNPP